jgi:hypothetical protein
MADTAIHERGAIFERTELAEELAAVLPPQQELFAVYVASGLSYRESARRAGFHEDNGFRLTKIPAVRARIEELASEPVERIQAGIDAELLMLRNRASNEDLDAEGRANVELRLKLIMAHARYRGWIVEKKQINRANMSIRAAIGNKAQFDALMAELIADLAPAQRARLKRIAAGEDDAVGKRIWAKYSLDSGL